MLTLIFSDPNLLPKLQVDKGAIKFILSGANIMAPGLTSPGARMDIDLPTDTVVVSVNNVLTNIYTFFVCVVNYYCCCVFGEN